MCRCCCSTCGCIWGTQQHARWNSRCDGGGRIKPGQPNNELSWLDASSGSERQPYQTPFTRRGLCRGHRDACFHYGNKTLLLFFKFHWILHTVHREVNWHCKESSVLLELYLSAITQWFLWLESSQSNLKLLPYKFSAQHLVLFLHIKYFEPDISCRNQRPVLRSRISGLARFNSGCLLLWYRLSNCFSQKQLSSWVLWRELIEFMWTF